jgi:glycosyltransferase involved in cell wall biosynthesis
MNILWFSWKDIKHPKAGGAETVSNQLRLHLVKNGHTVKLITAHYEGSATHEFVNGIEVFRVGNQLTMYWRAFLLFRKQFSSWPDLVIDEMNTMPFGCAFYTRKKSALLTYQLARKVWFYQTPFPVSLFGYIIEPAYLFLLSRRYKTVLTESESTKNNLKRFGFMRNKVNVFRVGMELKPLGKLPTKSDLSMVLVLGSVRPMKKTLDAVRAFEFARDTNPTLHLVIAGDNKGKYGQKVTRYTQESRHASSIKVLGRVDNAYRIKLMQRAAVIVVTSVKEGWGLVVTEANSQGTPAVVYDTDGLRDSVRDRETGLVSPYGQPYMLGTAINQVLEDKPLYNKLRTAAWQWSHEFTFRNSYIDFKKILGIDRTE